MIDAPITVNNNSVSLFDPTTIPFAMTFILFVAIVIFIGSKIWKNVAEAKAVKKNSETEEKLAVLEREKYEDNMTETDDNSEINAKSVNYPQKKSQNSEEGIFPVFDEINSD